MRSIHNNTKHLRPWFVFALIALLAAPICQAKDEPYESGKLIDVKPLRGDLMGYRFTSAYLFTVQAGDLLYMATCQTRDFRAADWIVNDPVIFRTHKNDLFLKQSQQKKVFRLTLAGVMRVPAPPPKDPASNPK